MKINGFLSNFKRSFRSICELQYDGSQISVERKNRMVGGVCFITDDVRKLCFPVESPLFTPEHRNDDI